LSIPNWLPPFCTPEFSVEFDGVNGVAEGSGLVVGAGVAEAEEAPPKIEAKKLDMIYSFKNVKEGRDVADL
jgi:hypothetical protein